ncbi:MAG: hypothetical protein KAW91_02260, partial [candidate division Zixibacteria bacterium]|nr:hypothetical protein [candidate division Zixibacteria bacterium]
FRQDLYYRLSAMTFRLPPLCDRREDIPLLVNHFLEGTGKTISPETMKLLVAFDWPGNVRELDNEIKKLVLLAGDNDEIKPEIVSRKLIAATGDDHGNGNGSGLAIPAVTGQVEFDQSYGLYDYLADHEKVFIIRALREKSGVKKHAAALLSIPESTLRLKIKQYDIDLNHLDQIH